MKIKILGANIAMIIALYSTNMTIAKELNKMEKFKFLVLLPFSW